MRSTLVARLLIQGLGLVLSPSNSFPAARLPRPPDFIQQPLLPFLVPLFFVRGRHLSHGCHVPLPHRHALFMNGWVCCGGGGGRVWRKKER